MNNIVPPANSPGARLPPEIWAEIISFLHPDELNRLSQVNLALRDLALSEDWRVVDSLDQVIELFEYLPSERQNFADRIREFHLHICQENNFNGLTFPKLKRLHVFEDLALPGALGFAVIDQFIQPALQFLNIQKDVERRRRGNGSVSNILPLMATQTPYLTDLTIAINMPHATGSQLATALRGCPLLKHFVLTGRPEALMDAEVFTHLALNSRLEQLVLSSEIHRHYLDEVITGLPAYHNIFEHLTVANFCVEASAGRQLFSRMKALRTLTLGISEASDILNWVAEVPQLRDLDIRCIKDMPLDHRVLGGLQRMNLEQLIILPARDVSIDGSEITVDQLDYLFGSHRTLRRLEFAWGSSSRLADLVSFLQHSPHVVIEKVARFYPNVLKLRLPAPCAAMDFLRTPDIPLNMRLENLVVNRIVEPFQTGDPNDYARDRATLAAKIGYHFPYLQNISAAEDPDFVEFVVQDLMRLRALRNMHAAAA